MSLLTMETVEAFYGGIKVLKGVSLHVSEGEIVTLIGANGAGKTTTLATISGLMENWSGTVTLAGESLRSVAPHDIVMRGVAHVPEGRHIFPGLSVHDNLLMGAFPQIKRGCRASLADNLERVFALFPVLKERIGQLGGTLSGGEQQMLAIGRALMSGPKLLLLDEPSTGLAPILVREIFDTIAKLKSEQLGILLVEQNARSALRIADRGYVLEVGDIIFQGEVSHLMEHKEVKRAYLGKGYKEVWE